ncbi:MAG: DUF2254 domain-containing protein [Deltaproteobacteria bacterium]|nr:DUF2254 domain-containing protein [Deltaproteobacteria bacterium]MBN2672750.1 DUF2254 domain-containing protein [Deltaproteobacteria bacterium]
MKTRSHQRAIAWGPLIALVSIGSISILLCLITAYFDFNRDDISLKAIFFESINSGAVGGLPEVIIGILGVSITVVAIIVELASNRYTARITDLFMSSGVNITILGFFVVTGMLCLWVTVTTGSHQMVPHVGSSVTIIFVAICLLLLLPYFAFVFNFLNPHNIIDRMAGSVFSAITSGGSDEHQPVRMKKHTVRGIEQLADVASGAIESKDKVVCMHAVDALGRLACDYLDTKSELNESWFTLTTDVRENPDFVSMQKDVLTKIEQKHYWLEMKILRQFQMLYGESLNRMRDINYLLAINTRKIAERALQNDDEAIVALCVKFFNTYMRATINAKDVRTAYNILNQYRLLAQNVLENHKALIAIDIAKRFKYYGQLGFSMGLPFVLETAAYDLCDLNEMAYKLDTPAKQQLLDIFLDVDKEAEENHSMEASLRGVRKAQIKLATFYLVEGAEELAKCIFNDMKDEIPSRLSSIREELKNIKTKEFWEINDRGINFDYLESDRRAALETYFSWFK